MVTRATQEPPGQLTVSYDQDHHDDHHPDHNACQEAQEDDEQEAGEHGDYQASGVRRGGGDRERNRVTVYTALLEVQFKVSYAEDAVEPLT